MKLNKKPFFVGNKDGHCTVNAIANLLHFKRNAASALNVFKSLEGGYMISQHSDIVKYIFGRNKIGVQILHYTFDKRVNQDLFYSLYDFNKLAEHFVTEYPEKRLFIGFIFSVKTKTGLHSISGYYGFNSELFILMDSAGEGKIWIDEVAGFFNSNFVYGISLIVEQSEGYNYPFLISSDELKIYEH